MPPWLCPGPRKTKHFRFQILRARRRTAGQLFAQFLPVGPEFHLCHNAINIACCGHQIDYVLELEVLLGVRLHQFDTRRPVSRWAVIIDNENLRSARDTNRIGRPFSRSHCGNLQFHHDTFCGLDQLVIHGDHDNLCVCLASRDFHLAREGEIIGTCSSRAADLVMHHQRSRPISVAANHQLRRDCCPRSLRGRAVRDRNRDHRQRRRAVIIDNGNLRSARDTYRIGRLFTRSHRGNRQFHHDTFCVLDQLVIQRDHDNLCVRLASRDFHLAGEREIISACSSRAADLVMHHQSTGFISIAANDQPRGVCCPRSLRGRAVCHRDRDHRQAYHFKGHRGGAFGRPGVIGGQRAHHIGSRRHSAPLSAE